MRVKALGIIAAVALAGAASLAGSLSAQEEPDVERRVRVLALGQGSYLGVYISDITGEDVQRLGLREERGVRITGVAEDGPAQVAGLQEDDVIVTWNGDRIEGEAQLRRILSETPAGRSATLGVIRDGSERSVAVELGHRGGARGALTWDSDDAVHLREQLEKSRERLGDLRVHVGEMPHVITFMSQRGGRLGVGIQGMEPQLAEYFGLDDRTGVLITTVKEDSPAAQAGLKAGDVIVALEGEEVEGPGDVSRLIWGAEAGSVALGILRDRREMTVTVELPEAENSWQSDGGDARGWFFRDGKEREFEQGDVGFEWVEPLHELVRPEVMPVPSGRVNWVPVRATSPQRRTLSI